MENHLLKSWLIITIKVYRKKDWRGCKPATHGSQVPPWSKTKKAWPTAHQSLKGSHDLVPGCRREWKATERPNGDGLVQSLGLNCFQLILYLVMSTKHTGQSNFKGRNGGQSDLSFSQWYFSNLNSRNHNDWVIGKP